MEALKLVIFISIFVISNKICRGKNCSCKLYTTDFQSGVNLPPRDNSVISDVIFDCHNWGEGDCYRHLVVEARGATKHPTMHMTTPTTKNYLAQNVNNAEVEKPWSIPTHCLQTNALQGCTFPLSRCPSTKKKLKIKGWREDYDSNDLRRRNSFEAISVRFVLFNWV